MVDEPLGDEPASDDGRRAGRRDVRTPRIVAFAFNCEPGGGSEGGAGWVWLRLLARIGDVTILVAPSDAARRLEDAVRVLPSDEAARIRVEVVEHPRVLRRPLAANRWPPLWYVEYTVWQIRALRRARTLHRERRFDLAWHLTWANAWFGSLAASIGPDFVFGPVGGGVGMPWRLVSVVGVRGTIGEVVRSAARGVGRWLNPVARRAFRRARLILVQNPETRDWLPVDRRSVTVVFPNVVLEHLPVVDPARRTGHQTALFAGRLHGWKGGALAIRAIALLPGFRLIVCGEGPDEARLRGIADRLGISDRVEFRGQVEREELLRTMAVEATVFLFPSLHDEGGWVVAEARAHGLPVVCLDRGGPPVLGGMAVKATWPAATVRRLATAVVAAESATASASGIRDLPSATTEVAEILAQSGVWPVVERLR